MLINLRDWRLTQRDVRPNFGAIVHLGCRVDEYGRQDSRTPSACLSRSGQQLRIRLLELSEVECRSGYGGSSRLDLTPKVGGFVYEEFSASSERDDDVLFESKEIVLLVEWVFAVDDRSEGLVSQNMYRNLNQAEDGSRSILGFSIHGSLDLVKE